MGPSSNELRILVGGSGSDFINDTATHTPSVKEWASIYCVTNCTFTTLTVADMSGTTASIALSAGQTIYGRFTNIKLATGSIIAYYT